jgi:exosome complex component RRP46
MVVQVLGSGWGTEGKRGTRDAVMATAVNAGMLALMNAGGVPLKGVVCAVAVGRRSVDSVLVLDPSEDEEAELSASGCFAFLFSNLGGKEGVVGRCVWTNWRAIGKGHFDERVLGEARELAKGAAGEVYVAIKKFFEDVGEHSEFEETALRKGSGRNVTQDAVAESQPDNHNGDDDDDKMEI